MSAKRKAAVLAEQRLARVRAEAVDDARALAVELARGEPAARFDSMAAGIVLRYGESAYRQLPIWIRSPCWMSYAVTFPGGPRSPKCLFR